MPAISFESLGLILFTTIFLSMLLVPATSSLARKLGAIDTPQCRSSHTTPKTCMSGLAITLSLIIACLVYLPHNAFLWAFLSGLLVVVATGVTDDIIEISPRWKFLGQIIAAMLFVYLSGLTIDHIGDLFNFGNIKLGRASFLFTVFCIVGAMNAFNLSDGLDGLAGGLALIAAVFFGYFAWHTHGAVSLVIAISLLGAIIGFLRSNSYPAKVFMGDNGSLMLGYVLAVLLVGLSHVSPHLSVVTLAMVVALPLLDTLLVMARRLRYGQSPFLPDRTHLHHRLLDLGLPHPTVVVVIYCIMLVFGILAVLLKGQPDWLIFSSLMGIGLLIFATIAGLQRADFHYAVQGQRRISTFRQTSIFHRMTELMQITAKPIGIIVLILLLIPAMFAPLLGLDERRILTLFLISGLLAVFSWKTQTANKSILHGAMYLAIFALLSIYEVSAVQIPSWVSAYCSLITALVTFWVVLKLLFSRHGEIIFASSFELLMLFVSWFIPFVVLVELHLPTTLVHAMQHACLLSIPFLLAMKINIRIHGGHNRWIVIPLVFGLIVVGMRSWL